MLAYFHLAAEHRGFNLPVATGLVNGGVGHSVKVDDLGSASLTSLLFIIVSLDIVQQRCAGGRQRGFVSYCR